MIKPEPNQRAKWCGLDRTGSAVFTLGSVSLPSRCPRCGSTDALKELHVMAYGDSKFVFGGVSVQKFSLNVPHCNSCVLAIEKASSKRFILVIPVAIAGLVALAVSNNLSVAIMTALVLALLLGSVFKPKPTEAVTGVSIVQLGKDKIAIRSKHKGWQADLQILNS